MRYLLVVALLSSCLGCTWGLDEEQKKDMVEMDAKYKELVQQLTEKVNRHEFLKKAIADPALLKDLTLPQAVEEFEQLTKDIAELRPAVSEFKAMMDKYYRDNAIPWWNKALTIAEWMLIGLTGAGSAVGFLRGLALRAITLAIEQKAASSKEEPEGVKATVKKEASKGLFGPLVAWVVNNFAGKAEKLAD